MKRSNLYLLIMAGIVLVFFLIARFTKEAQPTAYGFINPVKVLSIESLNLQAKDIIVDPATASTFPEQEAETSNNTNKSSNKARSFSRRTTQWDKNIYLRYYICEDTLKVEKVNPFLYLSHDTLNLLQHSKLPAKQHGLLELRIDGLQTILLNGKPVWNVSCKN
ncbi:hypothetical protein [Parabacteroides pacaensis]|uniref:hypothetical protein n=1 Tax=Parabacteroides pacaensis TaxID=2086575 RepID=UPI000D0F429F|nr:hypothetical protein [Parabacteroides pacaensis]